MDDDTTYRIVRRYFTGDREEIATGLSLEEAQAHCRDPETSSTTCTNWEGKACTQEFGPWFDSYEEE